MSHFGHRSLETPKTPKFVQFFLVGGGKVPYLRTGRYHKRAGICSGCFKITKKLSSNLKYFLNLAIERVKCFPFFFFRKPLTLPSVYLQNFCQTCKLAQQLFHHYPSQLILSFSSPLLITLNLILSFFSILGITDE